MSQYAPSRIASLQSNDAKQLDRVIFQSDSVDVAARIAATFAERGFTFYSPRRNTRSSLPAGVMEDAGGSFSVTLFIAQDAKESGHFQSYDQAREAFVAGCHALLREGQISPYTLQAHRLPLPEAEPAAAPAKPDAHRIDSIQVTPRGNIIHLAFECHTMERAEALAATCRAQGFDCKAWPQYVIGGGRTHPYGVTVFPNAGIASGAFRNREAAFKALDVLCGDLERSGDLIPGGLPDVVRAAPLHKR